ncbi:MAG: D-alanyl-D-alanine carboxypeptidase/D-alanyl-D-alanine endopeptidase [Halocynthiibacter sp.]
MEKIDKKSSLLSRRGLLTSAAALFAVPACARAPETSLRPQSRGRVSSVRGQNPGLRQLISGAGLSGVTGVAIYDFQKKKITSRHNDGAMLPPASVMKVITAQYALEALGADFRFETGVYATGPVQDGVVQGDVILKGGGDPMMDSDHLGDLAMQLKTKGIRKITGRFLIDDTALPTVPYIDGDQPVQAGYDPTISALNLNFNRVHFEWKPVGGGKYTLAMDARAKRYQPQVTRVKAHLSDRDLPIFTHERSSDGEAWSVARRALGRGGSRWLPVRDPALYVGDVFRTLARSHGVVLPMAERGVAANATRVGVHYSDPLHEIIRLTLKYSTNLSAEIMGLMATQKRGKSASSLKASAKAMTTWARALIGPGSGGLKLMDHSGLGAKSRVTAYGMVSLLAAFEGRGQIRELLKPIKERHKTDPSLKRPENTILAKTGTLDFVSSLAGYVETADGKLFGFSVMSGDLKARRAGKRAKREVPKGARSFNKRAKSLQRAVLRKIGDDAAFGGRR